MILLKTLGGKELIIHGVTNQPFWLTNPTLAFIVIIHHPVLKRILSDFDDTPDDLWMT